MSSMKSGRNFQIIIKLYKSYNQKRTLTYFIPCKARARFFPMENPSFCEHALPQLPGGFAPPRFVIHAVQVQLQTPPSKNKRSEIIIG